MEYWKRLTSGKYVNLAVFRTEDVSLLDIETSLNRTTRFNGHGETIPLSVAQHSWLCFKLVEQDYPEDYELQLAVLLHDAAETYIGDVSTPVKKLLGNSWYNFAHPIEHTVNQALLFPIMFEDEILKAKVKYYDAMSLDIERRALWSNQRGKDKWPTFISRSSLKEKADWFFLAQNMDWVHLREIYNELWGKLNKTKLKEVV